MRNLRSFRRRATISSVADLPSRNDDETARDGFIPQNEVLKRKYPPLDLSIKSQIKIDMGDTNCFRRIKQFDWAKAAANVAPDIEKTAQVK